MAQFGAQLGNPKIDNLLQGGIHIEENFFPLNTYDEMVEEMGTTKMDSTYQPLGINYGNRMQAMPCYENAPFQFKQDFIANKIEKILNAKLANYRCLFRKIKTKELKKSHCNGKYGFIHRDKDNQGLENIKDLAAIMHFDQSFYGGTAFFRNIWEKVPDIYVSAFPNRLVIYDACRWHAPAFDYSFEERTSLAFFLKVINES